MKRIEDVTALVCDSGLFLPLAVRMAQSCKRLIYWSPDCRGFPSLRQGAIGDGFENVERVIEFWHEVDEIDLFIFPDIGQSELQLHLEKMGKAVWGSRRGDKLELGREYFMRRLGQMGLNVPKFEVLIGLEALREHLREVEDVYIKVSRWRGDFETMHWRSWAMDNGWLDMEAVNFGPLQNTIHFLVFEAIDTDLEIGGDNFCVDGSWPDLMLCGTEAKDKTFFGSVMKRSDTPEQLQEIMDALSTEFGHVRYRNQFSMEVRVVGDASYFIDPTCRGGMPSSASQYKLWSNWPEIVWAGANGELLDPEPSAMFSIECQITCKAERDTWTTVEIPEELVDHCNFSYCGFIDGCYVFPPDDIHHGELGWLIATGDTPEETLELAKHLCDQLPDGLDANVEGMVGLIKETKSAEDAGILLSAKTMPEPAEVISD